MPARAAESPASALVGDDAPYDDERLESDEGVWRNGASTALLLLLVAEDVKKDVVEPASGVALTPVVVVLVRTEADVSLPPFEDDDEKKDDRLLTGKGEGRSPLAPTGPDSDDDELNLNDALRRGFLNIG